MPRALWLGVALAVVGLLLLNGVPGGSTLGNASSSGTPSSRRSRSPRWSASRRATTPRALTFLQMATSCVGFTAIALARGELEVPHGSTVWGALLVTGIFAGALGYLIATWVQARTTAARAALVFTLEAPFAALFGVLLADEVLGWAGWLGCAVMMCGDRRRGACGRGNALRRLSRNARSGQHDADPARPPRRRSSSAR